MEIGHSATEPIIYMQIKGPLAIRWSRKGFPPDPQEIFTCQLAEVFIAPPPRAKFLQQGRQARDVAHRRMPARRVQAHSVEVQPNPDMVDPDKGADVIVDIGNPFNSTRGRRAAGWRRYVLPFPVRCLRAKQPVGAQLQPHHNADLVRRVRREQFVGRGHNGQIVRAARGQFTKQRDLGFKTCLGRIVTVGPDGNAPPSIPFRMRRMSDWPEVG